MQFLKLKGISALKEISFVGANKITKLIELDLRGTKVSDLSALNNYGLNLKSLILDYTETDNISSCGLSDIDTVKNKWRFLKEAKLTNFGASNAVVCREIFKTLIDCGLNSTSLTSLTCSGWGRSYTRICETLEGIENFMNLSFLNLNYGTISDISKLGSLTKLEKIYLAGNRVTDISSLESLSSLNLLSLEHNQISNLYALRNLKNLEYLNLSDNVIEDYSYHSENERFNNLNIIASLHPNSGGHLKELYLSQNEGIIDFTPVSSLTWAKWSGF